MPATTHPQGTAPQVTPRRSSGKNQLGSFPADIALEHVRTTTFPGGMVQSTYRVT